MLFFKRKIYFTIKVILLLFLITCGPDTNFKDGKVEPVFYCAPDANFPEDKVLPKFVKEPEIISKATSITLFWENDEITKASVKFGEKGGNLNNICTQDALTTSHTIEVIGLTPEREYEFEISVTDFYGNGPVSSSISGKTIKPILGAVVINEFVTDPQQDWNDSAGGDGLSFNSVPGNSTVSETDEWIELYNGSGKELNISNWHLVINRLEPASDDKDTFNSFNSSTSTKLVFSNGGSVTNWKAGEYLVIGNPPDSLPNDNLTLLLFNEKKEVIDAIYSISGGNSNSISDESFARIPNRAISENINDVFFKTQATIGAPNPDTLQKISCR